MVYVVLGCTVIVAGFASSTVMFGSVAPTLDPPVGWIVVGSVGRAAASRERAPVRPRETEFAWPEPAVFPQADMRTAISPSPNDALESIRKPIIMPPGPKARGS